MKNAAAATDDKFCIQYGSVALVQENINYEIKCAILIHKTTFYSKLILNLKSVISIILPSLFVILTQS